MDNCLCNQTLSLDGGGAKPLNADCMWVVVQVIRVMLLNVQRERHECKSTDLARDCEWLCPNGSARQLSSCLRILLSDTGVIPR